MHRISVQVVVKQIKDLFNGHTDLLSELNSFLPDDFKLELSKFNSFSDVSIEYDSNSHVNQNIFTPPNTNASYRDIFYIQTN